MNKPATIAAATLVLAAVATFAAHAQDTSAAAAQTTPAAPTPAQLTEVLSRSAEGHSPTADEILAVESAPGTKDADAAKALAPLLDKALTSQDGAVRQYALAMMIGLEILPDDTPKIAGQTAGQTAAPATQPTPQAQSAKPGQPAPPPPVPSYQGKVGTALAALIPDITARLTDDLPDVRNLAASVLGGFAPNPPASVYPPIYAWLKRDDAIADTGVALVTDLLRFSPISDQSIAALSTYVRRSDQTSDSRGNLVEAIAAQPQQSQAVNHALLSYLDADDPGLRARVILSLPQLDFSKNDFEDARGRVHDLAASDSQAPQGVVAAARSVTACWTQSKMTSACPVN